MAKKTKSKIESCKAWALIDPDDPRILPYRIYDERVQNGGRGSVTDGWKCIRVEIREVRAENK